MDWDTVWRERMFREFKKNLTFLYTLSTGLILTLIVILAFLFSLSSQNNRRQSTFQNHLFTLTSKLQSDTQFTDLYLAQMETQNKLVISIKENGHSLFFPGAYETAENRDYLIEQANSQAEKEGIYEDSQPISSNMLKSSVFSLAGNHSDKWLGNVLIIRTDTGYKKLILLSDESGQRMTVLKMLLFYLFMDGAGIFLLYLTGRRFVRRSTGPLEENYRKQQDFVAAASHELRSPLAVIQTNAAAIADAPQEIPRLLSVIQKECDRGSSLIKNLLLLANADQDNLMIQKQNLEIDELLLHLLELYEPVFHARNAALLLELTDELLPPVQADPQLCLQIFTILLDNAAAYGLEHNGNETVMIKAESAGSMVYVSVIDHGPGISDEEKERVFDRFYRGDRSRSKKDHFGLGLSIASEIAAVQNLELEVKDTNGGGSTFVVKFRAA